MGGQQNEFFKSMEDDEELFHINLEQLGYKPEDFTNEKFRGEDD